MVNWEFFDNQTPESADALVDGLRSGDLPTPTRGAVAVHLQAGLAGAGRLPDGRADEGVAGRSGDAGRPASSRKQRGDTAHRP